METVNDTNPPTDSVPPYRQPGNHLTRSTDDKVLGGLSGGLARWFGIDPVVFRIAFVVLTLAGGSGILLYLIGWLLIPDDRGGTALQRFGDGRKSKLAAAVMAGAGVLILLDNIGGGNDGVPLGLVLVAAGGAYLWSRQKQADAGPPAPQAGPPAPPAPLVPPTGPNAPDSDPEAAPRMSADAGTETTTLVADPPTAQLPAVGAARPPRRPSVVVPVTLSLLAVLAGGLSLAGASLTTGLALALVVTGGGLIVGAWRGRAKWLIPVGLVLAVSLGAATVVDVPIRGGTGDVAFRPVGVAEVQTPYRLAAGQLILDLSAVDLQGQTLTVVASVAAGHLDVVVPADVAVEIDAHVGAGDLMLLGRESDGLDVSRSVSDPGREGAGRLVLRARAGMGLVEVRRAAA